MTDIERVTRAVSSDGRYEVVRVFPIPKEWKRTPHWEIRDRENFDAKVETYPDTGQDAAEVLRSWEEEQG